MKIVLADDHTLVLEGLRRCFDTDPDFEVCGTASNGDDFLELVRRVEPDVALVDITMPGMNGIEAIRILNKDPEVRTQCIVLSMHREREFVSAAFKNGARGYLMKSSSFAELREAVHTVMRGKRYFCPNIAELLVENMDDDGGNLTPLISKLTPRERQTLQLLAEGLSVKEIALKLGVNFKTIHTYRSALLKKLDCSSIADLTKLAIRHGMTNLD